MRTIGRQARKMGATTLSRSIPPALIAITALQAPPIPAQSTWALPGATSSYIGAAQGLAVLRVSDKAQARARSGWQDDSSANRYRATK